MKGSLFKNCLIWVCNHLGNSDQKRLSEYLRLKMIKGGKKMPCYSVLIKVSKYLIGDKSSVQYKIFL